MELERGHARRGTGGLEGRGGIFSGMSQGRDWGEESTHPRVTLHVTALRSSASLPGVPRLPVVPSDRTRPPVERQGSQVNTVEVFPATSLSLVFH